MVEWVDSSVLYKPVSDIRSLCIIIDIYSAEGLIPFLLEISNTFKNTIMTNPEVMVYLSLQSSKWKIA